MNNMRNNKLVIGSFLMLSLFASCSKVIDVKETDFIGGDVALKTVDNIESGKHRENVGIFDNPRP